jgi:hypothetical protein
MLLKNKLIMNRDFIDAFSSLMSIKMPAKQCLEVSSCIEDLIAQYQILTRARRAIADKYCSKDEDGNPLNDNDNLVFETPELQKKCLDEINEIYEEEIDLELTNKIKISKTEPMTPIQVRLLRDIIEINESEPENKKC